MASSTVGRDEPVRLALLGYGTGARWFHAPLIADTSSCELVGVITRSPDRRALVASDHPAVNLFDDLEAAVAAGAEAVAISTPAATHSELTDRALGLGLHVVCDKPFALDSTAAARSAALAAHARLVLSPYQNRRWDSDFLTVRQVVDRGRLGAVRRFESRFERFDPQREPSAAGGGTLLDFGSHLVDQALVLLGPVDHVYAEWHLRPSGLDDDTFVELTHTSGARSQLWGSWIQGAPGERFRVTGTEAAYVVDGPMDGQEAALRNGASPATLGTRWGAEPEERWGSIRRGTEPAEIVPTVPGAWPAFYELFAAAVRGNGAPPTTADEAVATATVLDAARRSARTSTVVSMTGG